jgi:Clostridium epsilon toxin ETX/Bacillus mosquitocidal toxin MTX2
MDYLKGFGLDGKSTIEYHIDKAKILSQGENSLYSQRVKNDGPVDQTSEISGSETVTEEFGYSNSLGVTVGVSTEFTCGFPYLAEEKIEISVETSYEHEWSGSNSRSKTWSFSTPMNVPPHMTMVAKVVVKKSKIAVPYTVVGGAIVTYQSGTTLRVPMEGIYTKVNSHDLTVLFTQVDPPPMAKVKLVTKKIVNATYKYE